MAFAFRDSVSATFTSIGSTKQVTLPATIQAGDLLVAQWITGTAPDSTPSGWTLLQQDTNSIIHYVYYRIAQSTDAGALLTIPTSTTVRSILSVFVYSGVSGASPFQASSVKTETVSQTTHTSNTVTTSSPAKVIQLLAMKDPTTNSVTRTGPAGYTLRQNVTVGPSFAQVSMVADSTSDIATGTVPSVTFTSDQSTINASVVTIALAPQTTTVAVRPSTDVTLPAGATVQGGASQAAVLADDDPNTYVSIPLGSTAVTGETKFPTLPAPLSRIVAKIQCEPATTTLSAVFSLVQGTTVIRSYTAFTTVNTSGEAVFDQAVAAGDQTAQTNLADIRVRYAFTGS